MHRQADLRFSELGKTRPPTKLMNAKVPDTVMEGITRVAAELGCSKTVAVIALFNEGLDAFAQRRGEFPKVAKRAARRGRPPVAARGAAAG